MSAAWPDIPYEVWRETCSALHLYLQIVGKYRLARTPWVNHSWHATFYVNARGFTTSLVPDGPDAIEIVFDLLDHTVSGGATDGRRAEFRLGPMSVADFHGASAICSVRSAARLTSTAVPMKCPTRFHSLRTTPLDPTASRP